MYLLIAAAAAFIQVRDEHNRDDYCSDTTDTGTTTVTRLPKMCNQSRGEYILCSIHTFPMMIRKYP